MFPQISQPARDTGANLKYLKYQYLPYTAGKLCMMHSEHITKMETHECGILPDEKHVR